jgi:DNA-binding NarL/FixJ family response regulator
MRTRLMIAEDHDVVRENIKCFLRKCPDIDIIGEANDGEKAVALAGTLSPDIVLMDFNMPRLNGIAAAAHILSANPQTRVVILSANADSVSVAAGLRAGISGYVLKSSLSDDLIPALRTAMAREFFLSPQIADVSTRDRARPQPKTDDPIAET